MARVRSPYPSCPSPLLVPTAVIRRREVHARTYSAQEAGGRWRLNYCQDEAIKTHTSRLSPARVSPAITFSLRFRSFSNNPGFTTSQSRVFTIITLAAATRSGLRHDKSPEYAATSTPWPSLKRRQRCFFSRACIRSVLASVRPTTFRYLPWPDRRSKWPTRTSGISCRI